MHGSPNLTNTYVWLPRITKHYIYSFVGTHCTPHLTNNMVWRPMAHHTIRIQWFGSTWLTKQYKYNDLNVRGSPNATYTMVWGTHGWPNVTNTMVWWPAAHQTFVYNGLGTHDSPNLTNTLVWFPMAHQALHIPWCGGELVTKPYKYMSLNIHGSPNVTYP